LNFLLRSFFTIYLWKLFFFCDTPPSYKEQNYVINFLIWQNILLLLLLLEYVYPTERVQLRDRRIAREKKYIQKTLPKDVKRMLMYVIIFAHGI
jgi:hypothetical protein